MKTATAPLPPLRSVKVLTSCVSAYATCITVYEPNRLMSTGFVPSSVSTVCVTRQPWAAAKSRHFCPGWRTSARFRSPRTSGIGGLAVLLRQGAVHGSALASEIGRPRPSRRLPVVLTPDEVVRILGFLEGEHRLFAQLLYGTGMRISEVCNCGSRIWISITARSSCGRQGLQGSGLDVTRELGTQPARAAVACTGMVAEGPGRGPQRRCAS